VPSVILAMVDQPAAAEGLLAAAARLADLAGATHINVLVARVPPASTIMPTEQVLTREREARLRAGQETRVAALRAIFGRWQAGATAPRSPTTWLDIEAVAPALIVEWGRRADFIVVERPQQRDYGATWQALSAALFETDRPVLLVPPAPAARFGRTIAIAWRDDPHATRAVLSALRCTTPGTTRVHLLAGVRAGAHRPRIPAVLVEHGVTADLRTIPVGESPFGAALLAEAHAIGADMLVMGAFAHGRLRELILGGVTRYVIAQADVPVLMRH
jgi:nucleotide-binding universal stress UspA family protein